MGLLGPRTLIGKHVLVFTQFFYHAGYFLPTYADIFFGPSPHTLNQALVADTDYCIMR